MPVDVTLLHALTDVTIRRAVVSNMNNNAYVITHRLTGAQVLIDAADDAAALLRLLEDGARDAAQPAKLALIATTHQHADHTRALRALMDATGVRTAAGEEDAAAITARTGCAIDVPLTDGDVGNFDGFDLTAIHLRGHTPGSISFAYADPHGPAHIFTGDSLFPGGVGNTDGDAERFATLCADVVARLFDAYPDDTYIHPGHGASTTLGAERPQLAAWLERGW